jgi:tRNA(adenine34) deaminase
MTKEELMRKAIELSVKNVAEGGGPFGAVIAKNGEIVATGVNRVTPDCDPTAHAEMIALTSAFNTVGAKYLPEATLYVTVEPCIMCAGAIYWSKIGKIVFGADDEKNGYKKTAGANWPFHPKTELIRGVMKDECAKLMKDFFKGKR